VARLHALHEHDARKSIARQGESRNPHPLSSSCCLQVLLDDLTEGLGAHGALFVLEAWTMVDRMLAGRQQEVEAKSEERAKMVNDRMTVACAFDTIPREFRKHWLGGSVQEACHEGQLRGPFQCCSALLRNKLIFDHTADSIPS
jgi:hypothetical protein